MKKLFSNIWFWVVLGFTMVLVLLGNEKAKTKLLELELFSKNLDHENEKLSESRKEIQEKIASETKRQEELKKGLDQKDLDPSEVEEYWKKN